MKQMMTNDTYDSTTTPLKEDSPDLVDMLTILVTHWRLLAVGSVAAGALALGATYLVKPTYTARTSFLPPQQQQSSAASALASLGALSGLAGVAEISNSKSRRSESCDRTCRKLLKIARSIDGFIWPWRGRRVCRLRRIGKRSNALVDYRPGDNGPDAEDSNHADFQYPASIARNQL